jgi:Methyltransferase domain
MWIVVGTSSRVPSRPPARSWHTHRESANPTLALVICECQRGLASSAVAETHFDEWNAQRYQTLWPELFERAAIEPAVAFLAHLAGTGAALEFGIGTGRIAIPLSQRGVRVQGIELSAAMVVQLHAQDEGSTIGVTIGDFATTKVDGPFRLVHLLRNTITNLTTQDEQVAAFYNAAKHLQLGGQFVIEIRSDAQPSGLRGLRRSEPDCGVSSLLGDRGATQAVFVATPLRVACRARPHGTTRGTAPGGAMGRMESRTIQQREPEPHLGLGEGCLVDQANYHIVSERSRANQRRSTMAAMAPFGVREITMVALFGPANRSRLRSSAGSTSMPRFLISRTPI